MKTVNHYISELLYHFDCVIIPGLGGLVTHYKSAKWNVAKQLFTNPSKSIAFNASLNQNDALLANYIAKKESISYESANALIQDYVVELQQKLTSGSQIKINEVGYFFLSNEGSIQFEPDYNTNYLLDTYGLNAIHAVAIRRESEILNLHKKLTRQTHVSQKWIIYTTAASIALFISIATPLYNLQQKSLIREADKNTLSNADVSAFIDTHNYLNTLPLPDFFKNIKISDSQLINIKPDTVFIGSIKQHNVKKITSKEEQTALTTKKRKYKVIAGVFRYEKNAKNYINELRNKGTNASLELSRSGKRFRIVLGTFNNQEEAKNKLIEARVITKDAWILTL